MRIAAMLTKYCENKGYITQEQNPWLQYTIEKHLSIILLFPPLFILGGRIASPVASFVFLASFLFLRNRTNGIHAKTVFGCFCSSMVSELVILGLLFHILTLRIALSIMTLSSIVIFTMSPFNHPLMHLSPEEVSACAMSAKLRLFLLDSMTVGAYLLGYMEIGHSIVLGTALTATTLAGANIFNRGKNNERTADSCRKGHQKSD